MHTILNKLETGNKLQDTDEVAESNIYAKPKKSPSALPTKHIANPF